LQKNQLFFQILSELQKEESKYYIDYERRTDGILRNKKQKKINKNWGNQSFG